MQTPNMRVIGWLGDPKRGASMGRPSHLDLPAASPKVSLRRIRLDSGGYDSGGSYWGIGWPLYWVGSDCGSVDLWFRARDRDAAKAHVKVTVPAATFYR